MSISIADALMLNELKPLKLLNKEVKLIKRIDKIGILDHELIEGIKGNFRSGDFVLTTFTPIRNYPDLIDQAIYDLIDCNIAALAIKNIYVKEVSESVLSLANKKDIPIFLFESNAYFEDVIEGLIKGMHSRSYMEIIESKIETMFSNDLKASLVEEMAFELNGDFLNYHQVFFLKEKRYINDEGIIEISERYKRSRKRPSEHGIFKYRDGLLVVLTYEKRPSHPRVDLDYLMTIGDYKVSDFYIGHGHISESLQLLDKGIKEAVYANMVCEMNQDIIVDYHDIGLYKMLLPHKDTWMKSYVEGVLDPIKSYDDGKLIETARVYIKNLGDMVLTADHMFQHKNTIRYRIQKMKELMKITSDGEFYEQLSVAIKCEKICR
ncbi:hypothetical protein EZV73_05305 [Acidaminobacter sp. JC074]|uniref:helix-turn-helix domain-containing protein n=1 Tax=Acidaminobacter sp. JC074 TaxID=2530199 RepID=UPI001F10EA0D|nr:PucR family transcriptional regulator [Acidaminobacter sp. JC074]MCH4886973.1 hypothetical protein [Acidaminobacter sp. JC074]